VRRGRPHYFFLLQNNWRHKQFIEVDQRYFTSAKATAYFICDPPSAFRAHVPVLQARFAEVPAAVDTCDGLASPDVGCYCCSR
jgi:hypothetical protein